MPQAPNSELRLLDHCLTDRESLEWIKGILDRLDKCCQAVDRRVNLGEIVADDENREALARMFGPEGFEIGLQLLLKLALKDHHSHSFTVHRDLDGSREFDFIHRSIAAWKQFDMVLQISGPQAHVFNPKKSEHWKKVELIKSGSLVTLHLRTLQGKRIHAEEHLAAERFAAVFEVVQTQREAPGASAPVEGPSLPGDAPAKPVVATAHKPPPFRRPLQRTPAFTTAGPPVMDLAVTINKIDTFVHAGNAHLIVNLVKDYPGKVSLYVMRGAKKKISLDADTIWAAEIRNGETMLFEFFGPQPVPRLLKELARSVNKYTQMDKVANE